MGDSPYTFIALEWNTEKLIYCIETYIQYIHTLKVCMSPSGIVIHYTGWGCQSPNPQEIHCFEWEICVWIVQSFAGI